MDEDAKGGETGVSIDLQIGLLVLSAVFAYVGLMGYLSAQTTCTDCGGMGYHSIEGHIIRCSTCGGGGYL